MDDVRPDMRPNAAPWNDRADPDATSSSPGDEALGRRKRAARTVRVTAAPGWGSRPGL